MVGQSSKKQKKEPCMYKSTMLWVIRLMLVHWDHGKQEADILPTQLLAPQGQSKQIILSNYHDQFQQQHFYSFSNNNYTCNKDQHSYFVIDSTSSNRTNRCHSSTEGCRPTRIQPPKGPSSCSGGSTCQEEPSPSPAFRRRGCLQFFFLFHFPFPLLLCLFAAILPFLFHRSFLCPLHSSSRLLFFLFLFS
ncbi:MAG: hypothetical protein JOS17DRAFT_489694 [Linnemannia elongata]|nr:MAG: hypothetical protein JOS17DRAFT_489694 [Linnemannia elongata]